MDRSFPGFGVGALTDRRLRSALAVEDLRVLARKRLPRIVFEMIDRGIGDDLSLHENTAAFDRVRFRPRSLADTRVVDLGVKVLGDDLDVPFLLAPCAYSRVCDPGAEVAIARAAGRMGTAYVLPGGGSESLETVAAAAHGPLWYQHYLSVERDTDERALARAAAAGYRVLCISVDTPSRPFRQADFRNNLTLPVTLTPTLLAAGLSRPGWAWKFLWGNTTGGFSATASRAAYAILYGDGSSATRTSRRHSLAPRAVVRPDRRKRRTARRRDRAVCGSGRRRCCRVESWRA